MAPLIAVIFLDDPPPPPTTHKKNLTLPQDFTFFNILYYSTTWHYCAHYEDETYNPYTTESSSVKKKLNSNERKVKHLCSWAIVVWLTLDVSCGNHWNLKQLN